jgi:hypothetical protein
MKYMYQKIIASIVVAIGIAAFAGLAMPSKVAAEGETFTWKDSRTITVSGPDLRGTSDLLLSGFTPSGDQNAIFTGQLLYNRGERGCTITIQLILFNASGDNSGQVWNPPPYDDVEIGDADARPRCFLAGETGIDPAIHNQWFSIGGTRPQDPNAPEREEEKRTIVAILAPDPMSEAPRTVTITIRDTDGDVVAQKTVGAIDDSGVGDYPPEETPVFYEAEFILEPGQYQACANYVITSCENFTKVKYEILRVTYGDQYQLPFTRNITINVRAHGQRPCGTILTQGPITITLANADGNVVTKATPPTSSTPIPGERDGLCTVDVVLAAAVNFEDMPPGTYEACAPVSELCVTVVKADGEAASATIELFEEFIAPDEQPVCNAGTGFAGVLAFILCPVTQLIVSATDFIEKNLIIPYLTVSPLSPDPSNAIYRLWDSVRNIANVLFIVAFFMVIFSQATSVGLSNYGIKRLLPRLAIVAIGTNLSYYLVAFVIDAFNVMGAGVGELVMSVIIQGGGGSGADSTGSIFGVLAVGLAAVIFTGGAALGWLFSLLGIVFLIILVAVVTLVLRQMLILMLVILSPLAFVAWLLPNTEKYFTKWRELLIKLLMMYPLIVLLFAIGKIVAALLTSGDIELATGAAGSEGVTSAIKLVLSTFAAALPLVLIPATFAAGGTMISKLYNGIQNRGQTAQKALGDKGKPFAAAAAARLANKGVPGISNKNKFGRMINRPVGLIAGRGIRREAAKQSREREVSRAQSEYVAKFASGEEGGPISKKASALYRFRAGGIGGQEGRNRALAGAYATQEKAEREELENGMALLRHNLEASNIDQKTFVGGDLIKYLRTGEDTLDKNGNSLYKKRFEGNPIFLKAALSSAAEQGEVGTIETARLTPGLNQGMVDSVIRLNDGKMKEKGGYHLATNFELAAGRMVKKDASGNPVLDAQGNPQLLQGNAAEAEILAQRVKAVSSSGANSIAGMKASILGSTADVLEQRTAAPGASQADIDKVTAHNQRRSQILTRITELDHEEAARTKKPVDTLSTLKRKATEISTNSNTRARTEAPEAIDWMMNNL